MKRPSTKRVQTVRAISLAIENVVVVVVVTIRAGSLGSGMRLDCENLSEPRFVIASSVVNVWSIRLNRTRCGVRGSETMRVAKRSFRSCDDVSIHAGQSVRGDARSGEQTVAV